MHYLISVDIFMISKQFMKTKMILWLCVNTLTEVFVPKYNEVTYYYDEETRWYYRSERSQIFYDLHGYR